VLAAVGDSDLGEASAINDAAARVGAVILVALAPVLIGLGPGSSLAEALTHGYRQALIIVGGLCVAAAATTWRFVSDPEEVARNMPISAMESIPIGGVHERN
jgi:hypothetical protein